MYAVLVPLVQNFILSCSAYETLNVPSLQVLYLFVLLGFFVFNFHHHVLNVLVTYEHEFQYDYMAVSSLLVLFLIQISMQKPKLASYNIMQSLFSHASKCWLRIPFLWLMHCFSSCVILLVDTNGPFLCIKEMHFVYWKSRCLYALVFFDFISAHIFTVPQKQI